MNLVFSNLSTNSQIHFKYRTHSLKCLLWGTGERLIWTSFLSLSQKSGWKWMNGYGWVDLQKTLFSQKNAFRSFSYQLSAVALVLFCPYFMNSHISFHFPSKAIFPAFSLCPFLGTVFTIHHHITKGRATAHSPRAFLIMPFRENTGTKPRDKRTFTAVHSSSLKGHLGLSKERGGRRPLPSKSRPKVIPCSHYNSLHSSYYNLYSGLGGSSMESEEEKYLGAI